MSFEKNIRDFCNELAETLIKKNKDYGDSYTKTVDEYGLLMGLVRIDDKLNRLKSIMKHTDGKLKTIADLETNVTESPEDTLLDIAGYSILFLNYINRKKQEDCIFEGAKIKTEEPHPKVEPGWCVPFVNVKTHKLNWSNTPDNGTMMVKKKRGRPRKC